MFSRLMLACVIFSATPASVLPAFGDPMPVASADSKAAVAPSGVIDPIFSNGFDLPPFVQSASWTCGIGVSCQDVYEFDFLANNTVRIQVADVTGASVLRLAAFAPGVPLNGQNLLTGVTNDRRCLGQNLGETVGFRTGTTGRYRIAIGRDWGLSAGKSGNYTVTISSPGMTAVIGQTANDQASGAVGSQCGFTVNSSWTCAVGESCQDVYDFELAADVPVSISASGITGASVVRLAAFAPGSPLSAQNLLTGLSLDRKCVGQNMNDSVPFLPRASGRYRIAAARDWGSSAGASGNYSLTVSSPGSTLSFGQTVNDQASGASGSQCGYTYQTNSNWVCATGVDCQDVYDFYSPAATSVSISVNGITGASVVRLALFDGGAVNSVNRLNGGFTDRQCVGQNVSDSIASPALPTGQHRLAVGRDWGSSAGATGNYSLQVTTNNIPLAVTGQTTNDTPSAFATGTCP